MNTLRRIVWQLLLPFVKIYYRIYKGCHFAAGAFFTNHTVLEGHNYVGSHTTLIYSTLGYGSYVSHDSELLKTKVGKYCSIASHVSVISGQHPSRDYVSTNPAFFSKEAVTGLCYTQKETFSEASYAEENYYISVGNDVWIGQGCSIMEGVRIGDGAIVGAGALVLEDVPDYAVAAGVPAKIIRYRFKEEEIAYLKKLQWWDKGEAWIKEHAVWFDHIGKLMEHDEENN